MSFIRAATVAAFLGLLLLPLLARAQTAPPPQTVLPPVTVTAGRGTDLEKLDVSTTVIPREQIEAMPETSVDQIVNRIPGVWTLPIPTGQLHPTGQPFNIRGFGSSTTINTLVMVDGVPMNDPYFRTVDWSSVSKASIDRIEVIRGGGATSLWGNMAMGGIVNIITRQPSRTGASLDVNYGSRDTFNGDVAGTVVANDRLKVGATYGHSQSAGYNLTPAQYRNINLVPTGSKVDNVSFSAYLTPSDDLKLFAKAYYHQAYEDGLVWYQAHNQWSSYRLLMGGSYAFDETSSLNFSAWAGGGTFGTVNVGSGSYTLNNINALNQFVSQIETAPNNNQGGSVFYSLDAGPLKDVKIGVDLRRTQVTDYISLFSSATAAPSNFVAQGEHRLEGVFGQGTWSLTSLPLDITVGVRGDFYQAVGASVLTMNTATTNVIADSSHASFDPRIGLKYYVTDELVLRGAAYRNFSEPGMNQMYRSFAAGTSYTATNPNLQPMTNFGQEAGFDFKWREFSLSGTVFNNNLDNFIDFVTICNSNAACAAPFVTSAGLGPSFTTVRQYNNVGSANFRGFEIMGGWQILPELRLTAGFTRTIAQLTSSNFPVLERTGVQLGQVPDWMLNVGVEWRPIANLAINANLKSFPGYWNDTGHTQFNEAATLIDVGATYSFNKSLELYGLIQNLTNAQYLALGYTLTSFEGPTVSQTSIPALGMPFTAAVGMRARFLSHHRNPRRRAMRGCLLALIVAAVAAPAAAQHNHSTEALTATPAFGSDGTLWLVRGSAEGIVVARSSDEGRTFSSPVAVNRSRIDIDWGPDARPRIVVAPDGEAVVTFAVFQDKRFNGRAYYARSTGGGAAFGEPKPVTADATSQRFETAGIDPSGRLFAAWLDKRNVAKSIAAGRPYAGAALAFAWADGAAGFGSTHIAADNTCECCRLGLAFAGPGRPAVIFRNIFAGSIRDHAVVTFENPDTPGPLRRVSVDDWKTDACPHQGPSLAIAPDGSQHAAWFTDGARRKGLFYARADDAKSPFGQPLALSPAERQPSRPYVLATQDAVHLVWKEFDGDKTQIRWQVSHDRGLSWSAARTVAETADASDHPLLVARGTRAYLSWLTKLEGYRLLPLGAGS